MTIKAFYLFLKSMQMSPFKTIYLYSFHHWYDEVSDLCDEFFIFFIKRIGEEICIEIANQVHPAFLLSTCDRVIPKVKIGHEDASIVLQKVMNNRCFPCFCELKNRILFVCEDPGSSTPNRGAVQL